MINDAMMRLGRKPSAIRQIFEYSRARKEEIGEQNVFDFTLGNPSIPSPPEVGETIRKLLATCDDLTLHGYTSSAGDRAVREKIAQNIVRRFGMEAHPQNIYMTCGAAASMAVTLDAVCGGEHDEVILLAPFFPEYEVFTEYAGATPVIVRGVEPQFDVDLEALERAVTPQTAALIVNSPNNPTGRVISREQLEQIAAILMRKNEEYGRTIYLIADEPYRELAYDVEVPYLPLLYPHTVVCYSYSKSLSLPGERIGYVFVSPRCAAAADLFAAICGSARSMGYVCAPSLMQQVVLRCDGLCADVAQYGRNRRLLYEGLREIGYETVEPQGAFYLFVKALEEDVATFCERARHHELLFVPSDTFGVTGYVRIAYCVPYDMIQRALPAFRALYEEYRGESR